MPVIGLIGLGLALIIPSPVLSQTKAERQFQATVTDGQGIETEIKHIMFYWEEKVSDTAFVPHELRHVPVKKGTATVNVKFDSIKQIEVKPRRIQACHRWPSLSPTERLVSWRWPSKEVSEGNPTLGKSTCQPVGLKSIRFSK